jgi:hypothetical protein
VIRMVVYKCESYIKYKVLIRPQRMRSPFSLLEDEDTSVSLEPKMIQR